MNRVNRLLGGLIAAPLMMWVGAFVNGTLPDNAHVPEDVKRACAERLAERLGCTPEEVVVGTYDVSSSSWGPYVSAYGRGPDRQAGYQLVDVDLTRDPRPLYRRLLGD